MSWCDAISDLHASGQWRQDRAWVETEQLKDDIRSYRVEHPAAGLNADLFDRILNWKLRGQRARTEHHRVDLTPQNIAVVTEAAFSLDHPQRDMLAALRLRVLSSMPGVSSGVASAIMALSFPATYGVVDFRVWEVIFQESKTSSAAVSRVSRRNLVNKAGEKHIRSLVPSHSRERCWPLPHRAACQ